MTRDVPIEVLPAGRQPQASLPVRLRVAAAVLSAVVTTGLLGSVVLGLASAPAAFPAPAMLADSDAKPRS